MLHPESVAILDAALGCSDFMVDGTSQVAFHQLVAVRASVAPPSDSWPDTFLEHTTVQLPRLVPPVDPLGFLVAVDIVT